VRSRAGRRVRVATLRSRVSKEHAWGFTGSLLGTKREPRCATLCPSEQRRPVFGSGPGRHGASQAHHTTSSIVGGERGLGLRSEPAGFFHRLSPIAPVEAARCRERRGDLSCLRC
jgi:hypothetical protein